jgi:LysM repeat protein
MKNLLFIFFSLPFIAASQTLFIQGSGNNIYLSHKTGAKESFYSIGRIYNISPKIMAPYNDLVLEKGLAIGQVVKIPLNEINFSQDGAGVADEVFIPLYYKVKPKETLNNISSVARNVPVSSLKKWNKLSGDAVASGKNIVIGYLKVKKDLSPLASTAVMVDQMATTTEAAKMPGAEQPVAKKEESNKPVEIKNEPIKTEPLAEPVVQKPAPVIKTVDPANRKFNGGTFRNIFEKQTGSNEERGRAGTFKSTSGWQDGKYYCLHNSAPYKIIFKI